MFFLLIVFFKGFYKDDVCVCVCVCFNGFDFTKKRTPWPFPSFFQHVKRKPKV